MRTLRARWVTLTGTGAAASIAFGLLVFVSVLASLAIPRESVGLRTGALQQEIAVAQPSQRIIVGTANGIGNVVASDVTTIGNLFGERLAAFGIPLASDPPAWESLTTGASPVTGAPHEAGYGQPQLEMTYRTDLASYSRVVTGQLPVGGSEGVTQDVVQAAVTTATATKLGLRVGTRLNMGPVQLVITGIIQPVNPNVAFWTQDVVATRPSLTPGASYLPSYWIGGVFIGPGALLLIQNSLKSAEISITCVNTVSLNGLTAAQALALNANLGRLVPSIQTLYVAGIDQPVDMMVSSPVPGVLSSFIAGENAVAPVLELLYVSLVIMGAVVVLLGARLVAQRRTAEFTLVRARGASLRQLAWLVLRANLIIAAVAAVAAGAVAVSLTPGDSDPVGWWLAVLTIAVALVGPVLISVGPQRVAAPVTGRPLRAMGRRRRAVRRLVIEVALVAASIGGLAVLHTEGTGGVYSSAAPVLIAIPVAVVVLRVYPLLTRWLASLAGMSRGVVAFVGLARATRTPPGGVLPSFVLVLVLAMVAFPDMVNTAVTNSQATASWQQVGVDAIVQVPLGQGLSPAVLRQISSVPGVVSTAAGVLEGAELPDGFEMSVAFVDPSQYAAVVDQAPSAQFPLSAMSGSNSSVFPAAATTAGAQLISAAGGKTVALSLSSGPTTTIRLVAQMSAIAGLSLDAVAPLQALGSGVAAPNLVLISGSGLDGARLTSVVTRAVPDASVTLRSTVLSALTTAPVPQAAQSALVQGIAAAAGFGALVLLLSLLLTARTREMTLARLATMGLRRWQAQLLLATETLPPVIAAAIGGIACTLLLVPLVGPTLNLGAFSGTSSAAVAAALVPLLVAAAGLVLAALLILAVQATIAYHRGSTRALRIDD